MTFSWSVEFGSLTCPYCTLAEPALESLALGYADKGIKSIFLYTREAHPGENFPAHRDMEQKFSHALALRERLNVQRATLVDDIAGAGRHLYGKLPNMSYLISRGGRVLFRSDWTDPP